MLTFLKKKKQKLVQDEKKSDKIGITTKAETLKKEMIIVSKTSNTIGLTFIIKC